MTLVLVSENKQHLEEVQSSFLTWRLERLERGRRHLIPENLSQQAISLLPEYTPSQICRALRLDQDRFKELVAQGGENKDEWVDDHVAPKSVANCTPQTFTMMKVEDLMTMPNDRWSVSIERPDGCVLSIDGNGAGLNDLVSNFCSGGH